MLKFVMSLVLGVLVIVGPSHFAQAQAQEGSMQQMDLFVMDIKVDEKFFADCKANLEVVQGVLQCKVFQAPEGMKVFDFERFIGALRYYRMLSSSACNIEVNGVLRGYGQMWFQFNPATQTIVVAPDTMECMDRIIQLNKQLNSPFKDQSIYLIKK